GSCCSLDDIHDARGVADRLGVPFYVMNMEEAFTREVVDYFVKSYLTGSTPNPCIKCNSELKFEALLKKALALEADYLVTGHYARIVEANGAFSLLKGKDPDKDQSYFLFTMRKEQLERVLFPVGSLTKTEVRAIARKHGLKTSDKRESQEICFVEEPSYADFLSARIPARAGEIVDETGRVLGAHPGLFNYTIGQRKGLNLSGGPFYVLDIDVAGNRVVVGPEERLYSSGLVANGLNWIDGEAEALARSGALDDITVKIRYRHPGVASTVKLMDDGKAEVSFSMPQKAVTPGQAVVFYRGDEVLGGGWIERAIK
ncbi:MAG: tRNA 2-thiouridine(34) synthase MnmA, partial [Deltaproteobacteria bacterium]|nr:tRNA 2-thiouridine(34) synthase MnmA [Deltaproteobacteria bacterium]